MSAAASRFHRTSILTFWMKIPEGKLTLCFAFYLSSHDPAHARIAGQSIWMYRNWSRRSSECCCRCIVRLTESFLLAKRADLAPDYSWASALIFDSIILGLTLYAILVVNRRAKHLPILTQIWRDGILFYIVITAANLANVALYARGSYSMSYGRYCH